MTTALRLPHQLALQPTAWLSAGSLAGCTNHNRCEAKLLTLPAL